MLLCHALEHRIMLCKSSSKISYVTSCYGNHVTIVTQSNFRALINIFDDHLTPL